MNLKDKVKNPCMEGITLGDALQCAAWELAVEACQVAHEEEIKRLFEKLEEDCPHNPQGAYHSYLHGRKRECIWCMQAIKAELLGFYQCPFGALRN